MAVDLTQRQWLVTLCQLIQVPSPTWSTIDQSHAISLSLPILPVIDEKTPYHDGQVMEFPQNLVVHACSCMVPRLEVRHGLDD